MAVLPDGENNRFSLGPTLKNGWQMSDKNQGIIINKDGHFFYLHSFSTYRANLQAVSPKMMAEEVAVANAKSEDRKVLGHMSAQLVKGTAQPFGWKLTTKAEPYVRTVVAKAKQKNVPRCSMHQVEGQMGHCCSQVGGGRQEIPKLQLVDYG